jgi:ribonuclease BN (tRNA processing enzyme)
MELRVLGAHNLESKETRMEAHLIDGVLALDAGGLTRALSFEEQMGIRAIILSHRHFDHIRDLLPLGLAIRDNGVTVEVYAIQDTVEFVQSRLMDGSLYPDFLSTPSPENPTFRLNVVEPYKAFKVLEYSVVAVRVPHSVPAAGFQISSPDVRLFYTGDAGRGLSDAWKHVSPEVLLTEVTFGNRNEAKAIEVGHLTPALLAEALTHFKSERGYLPRVIVSHMSPRWEDAIRQELPAVAEQLGIEICVSHADMTLEL